MLIQKKIMYNCFLLFTLSYPSSKQFDATFNHLFEKSNLENIIEHGTYALIESSNNEQPVNPKISWQQFHALGDLLTQNNLPHHQIIGSYNGKVTEFSYIVIKSELMNIKEFRQIIFKLGQGFNQESVIISCANTVQLIFTTGPHAGRAYYGHGFHEDFSENFSVIPCMDNQYLVIGQYNLDHTTLSQVFEEFKPFCATTSQN